MSREEIDTAIDWAAIEGWNPGLHDAGCFYAADPTGFFMGKIGDTPVATMAAVRYGAHFGFAGLYIVKPEYRKKGYGIQIWNKSLDYLAKRTIGLIRSYQGLQIGLQNRAIERRNPRHSP